MLEPRAAVAIVRAGSPADAVLLMRRADREGDPWSGHWSFPGGRCAPQDSDLVHTALRELAEECGIRLSAEHLVAALPPRQARRKVRPFLLVAPFLFRVEAALPVVLDPREAVEALWVPLPLLRDPARHALRPVPGRPPQVLYPSVDLPGPPLWGFTYRLIAHWLGLEPGERAGPPPGSQAADLVLDFLLSLGLALERPWEDRPPARVAAVRGAIPVAQVLARFSRPGSHVPLVNALEVHSGCVSVTGLAYEEYRILAAA